MTRAYGWRYNRDSEGALRRWARGAAPVPALAVDLRPQCPPVYDQGALGSCTANAGAGAAEFEEIRQGLPAVTPSRLFIYWNERADQGDTADDTGSSISESIAAMNKYGLPPETEWPYDPGQFATEPPPGVFADALKARVMQSEGVEQSLDGIRSVLQAGLLVEFGFQVYESFESDAVAASGLVPLPGAGEQLLGGHAVLIVGDQPDQQRFIVRNSWGPQWGQAGYCTMPYAYLLDPTLANDFWAVQLVGASPA
jgi:C1A family cysteine protease